MTRETRPVGVTRAGAGPLPPGAERLGAGALLDLVVAPAAAVAARDDRLALASALAERLPCFLPFESAPGAAGALAAWLAAREAEVALNLRAVEDACEIVLTVEHACEDRPPDGGAASGRVWLGRRAAAAARAAGRRAELAAALLASADRLGAAVRANRLHPFRSRDGGIGADLALLVPRGEAAALRRRLEAGTAVPAGGRRLATGPWPCFSFGPSMPAGAAS